MSRLFASLQRLPLISRIAALAVMLAGAASLYVTLAAGGNPVGARSCAAGPQSAAIAAAAVGEVAAFQASRPARPLPELSFLDAAGKPTTLKAFEGRTVLLNLWATWCAPCRKEMPALDQLQAELGSDAFQVVAINIDQRNLDRPREWLKENGIARLAYFSDPETKVFQTLKKAGQAIGMPTTLLIDARGCQLGVLHGPAEWASADAKALIAVALKH